VVVRLQLRIEVGYGVGTITRLLKIIGLFCRILSLFKGSFAKETCKFKEPTNRIHPIALSLHDSLVFHTLWVLHVDPTLLCTWHESFMWNTNCSSHPRKNAWLIRATRAKSFMSHAQKRTNHLDICIHAQQRVCVGHGKAHSYVGRYKYLCIVHWARVNWRCSW